MSELQDLAALIRADTPLLVIETPDETRVVELFRQSLLQVWRAVARRCARTGSQPTRRNIGGNVSQVALRGR